MPKKVGTESASRSASRRRMRQIWQVIVEITLMRRDGVSVATSDTLESLYMTATNVTRIPGEEL